MLNKFRSLRVLINGTACKARLNWPFPIICSQIMPHINSIKDPEVNDRYPEIGKPYIKSTLESTVDCASHN